MTPLFGHFGGALYSDLLTQALSHLFPGAHVETTGIAVTTETGLLFDCSVDKRDENAMTLQWLGRFYTLRRPANRFTQCELALVEAIGRVLAARYRTLFNPDLAAKNLHLFQGLPSGKAYRSLHSSTDDGGLPTWSGSANDGSKP